MEYMSFDKFYKLILKRWKIVVYFMLVFLGLAVLYGILFYSPTYTSGAKILLKQNNPNTYVTQLNSDTEVSSLGQNKNPVLTQIEVLNSFDIALKVANKLSKDSDFQNFPEKQFAKAIQNSIKLVNPPGTDIIELTVSWNNPLDSQKITKALLDSYYAYNETLYKKSIFNTKRYIENQLKDTNQKLSAIREEIENYRKKNSSINIDLESGSLIDKLGRTENLLSDINANIASANKKVQELSQNLKVDLTNAVESVAIGQSQSLATLNRKLMEDQQKLASLKIKYPVTTPQIRVLLSEINEIKSQINNETITLIGKKTFNKNNSVISDSVRSEMVANFVNNNIELKSLLAQKETLQQSLMTLKNNQNIIPELQKTLQAMQEKEKSLASIVEILNGKLVEAKIKESAIVSNIDVVENPILPTSESFPTLFHITALFMFAGIFIGIGTILGLHYVEDICDGSNDLEEIIKAPVLGIIPWLMDTNYNNFLTDYNTQSVVAIIYQKIATSIKIKCYKKKNNSIGIISAELEKRRSIVTAGLANTFAKSDDRIILIDTDFRDGSLTREFNIDFSQYPDLTDLVLELSKLGEAADYNEIIRKFVVQIPNQKNLFLIPNNNKVNNPYEILNHDIFPKLIQNLKENFDFVIVDSAPMLAVADSIITSQYLDGLVVLCGVKTSRSNLRKIKKICDDHYVEILGAVARDTLTELEVPENMYIKQLSVSTD
ncbi:MAG: Wzz/FepE/Etk N-terminal domain-containing protein [bacterium]